METGEPSSGEGLKLVLQAPKPSRDLYQNIWYDIPTENYEPSEWQFVEGSDLSDAKIDEKEPSKARLEVEKIENCSTRLRYDFYGPDVPAHGGELLIGARRTTSSS